MHGSVAGSIGSVDQGAGSYFLVYFSQVVLRDRSKKVRIPHSSAIVKGIAENTITWETDPDFGYQVASAVPGIPAEDIGILQPRVLYAEQDRGDEHGDHVSRIQKERVEYMNSFPGLDEEIISALTS